MTLHCRIVGVMNSSMIYRIYELQHIYGQVVLTGTWKPIDILYVSDPIIDFDIWAPSM